MAEVEQVVDPVSIDPDGPLQQTNALLPGRALRDRGRVGGAREGLVPRRGRGGDLQLRVRR